MNTPIVMTVIAKDRPGLVEMISARVAQCGGNWEQSRMCRLGGQFAGIVQVNVVDSNRMQLLDSLHELVSEGLRIIVHEDESPQESEREISLKIAVIGHDHPGIIRDISTVLFKYEANVEELHTELQNEPHSGGLMFVANIRMSLAPGSDVDSLQKDLEDVAADLMVDLEVL